MELTINLLAESVASLPLPAITLIAVVVAILVYTYASKAMRSKKVSDEPAQMSVPVASEPTAVSAEQNSVELIETDEKTAAVIMAIVSDKSGIPLNRLAFKSIKLVEDK